MVIRSLAALLIALVSVASGHAACDPSTDPDATDIANARAAVATNCDCAGATSHRAYVKCAAQQANAVLANPDCVRSVKRCASHSTCGRPGFVTCCRTSSGGATRCAIKRATARCTAPKGGSRCIGTFASCCDACTASGCATTTTSTTTSTTVPSVCGNGVIDPGEQCDGEVFCTSYCRLPIYACCDIAVDTGVCSRNFTPEPGPPYCMEAGSTTHIGSHPSGGPECPQAGPGYEEGPCGDVTTFAPTAFCCQLGFPCSQVTLSDTGSLVSWLLNSCDNGFGIHPAVVGTCGADFQCHPR